MIKEKINVIVKKVWGDQYQMWLVKSRVSIKYGTVVYKAFFTMT